MKIQQISREVGAFQQGVDEQALTDALTKQLPDIQINRVIELNAGLFNNTYKVETSAKSYILKVAPSTKADVFYNEQALMQREQSIANLLESASDLIPKYHSFFHIDNRAAFLQHYVEGELWHDIIDNLSEAENNRLWQQLGAFGKKLHSIEGECFGYPKPFEPCASWPQFIETNIAGMLDDCDRLGVRIEEIDKFLSYLPKLSQALNTVTKPKLLHGDLWPRNVIIKGRGNAIQIKAVIDAERAFWGDPISDWVLLLLGVPEAFWQGYGENLLTNSDPLKLCAYKGMYFILNILETTRFDGDINEPKGWLSDVNCELERLIG